MRKYDQEFKKQAVQYKCFMQLNRFISDKLKLNLILTTSLFIFTLLLILGNQVISQSKEEMKPKSVSCDKQDDSKQDNDDEAQPFKDVLENNDENLLPDTKIKAIKRLGNIRAVNAVSSLSKYLDYEDKAEVLRRKPQTINGITVITQYNDLVLPIQYPAVGALIQIGQRALPALLKVIENENPDSIKSQNALYAIEQIFIEDELKAVLYLEKAGGESQIPNGSERLQLAAQKIKTKYNNAQKTLSN